MPEPRREYSRELPGGGYVVVETEQSGDADYRARLTVERRTDPQRRSGHMPPVIAESRGRELNQILSELIAIAIDNVAVARGLMRWQQLRMRDGKD